MFLTIKKIINLLEKNEQRFFLLLIFLMFFSALFEVFSLGSLIPLIDYFTNSNLVPSINNYVEYIFTKFNFKKEELLNYLPLLIIFIFSIKNIFLIFFHWVETKVIVFFRANLGIRLFKKYLNENFNFYLSKNSYEISSNIIQETAIFGATFLHLSMLFTEVFMMLGLLLFLFMINPIITLILLFSVLILTLIFYYFFKKKIKKLSIDRKEKEQEKQNILQQGLYSLKEIIIFKAQNIFENKYQEISNSVAKTHHNFAFISKLPKVWFELFSIFTFTILILFRNNLTINQSELLAFLSVSLITLIKLLPSANKILNSIQYINFAKEAVDNLYKEIVFSKNSLKKKDSQKLFFRDKILLSNINYKFDNSREFTLKNLDLEIKKNDKIGIMGESGSGKSTLLNIIAGLVSPSSGSIKIDGIEISNVKNQWLDKLGYVGQSTTIVEGSLANNIAFGVMEKNFDQKRLRDVIKFSGLESFLAKNSKTTEFFLEENGKNLSGGEKQRISIARSLYKSPEIIFFDESTNSLDLDTENNILKEIEEFAKNKTIIFISHKKSSLKFCNKVYLLKDKKLFLIK